MAKCLEKFNWGVFSVIIFFILLLIPFSGVLADAGPFPTLTPTPEPPTQTPLPTNTQMVLILPTETTTQLPFDIEPLPTAPPESFIAEEAPTRPGLPAWIWLCFVVALIVVVVGVIYWTRSMGQQP